MSKVISKRAHYERVERLAKDAYDARKASFRMLLKTFPLLGEEVLRSTPTHIKQLVTLQLNFAKIAVNSLKIEGVFLDYLEAERRPMLALLRDLSLPALMGTLAYGFSRVPYFPQDPGLQVVSITLSTLGILSFVVRSKSREALKQRMEDHENILALEELVGLMKRNVESLEKRLDGLLELRNNMLKNKKGH